MERSLLPAASVPRPALSILQGVFEGARSVTFREIQARFRAPRTTLVRNLAALVDAHLAYRDQRDHYILPHASTLGLLLVEPDSYARSLLLHEDVLPELGIRKWAYACLPVRRALHFDLPTAIPVVSPKLAKTGPRPSPTIAWYDYDRNDAQKATKAFPTWAKHDPRPSNRVLSTLHPKDALALLAATGDSRLTRAVLDAARKLGVSRDVVASAAARLWIEPPARRLAHPNSVMLPKWLMTFAETARATSARERLAQELREGGTR